MTMMDFFLAFAARLTRVTLRISFASLILILLAGPGAVLLTEAAHPAGPAGLYSSPGAGAFTARAAEIPAPASRSNLELSLEFLIEEAPAAGASFTCYRAGSYADFPKVQPGDVEKALEKISKEPGRFGLTGTTDARGKLTFSGLEEGVYVIRGNPVITDQYIYTPQPFLMSARDPATEEAVTARIKYEREDRQGGNPDPSGTGTPGHTGKPAGKKLPQTGILWAPVQLACSAGLLLITAGTYLRRRPENRGAAAAKAAAR